MRRTTIKYYAGLDVSLKEISICVVDGGSKPKVRDAAGCVNGSSCPVSALIYTIATASGTAIAIIDITSNPH